MCGLSGAQGLLSGSPGGVAMAGPEHHWYGWGLSGGGHRLSQGVEVDIGVWDWAGE